MKASCNVVRDLMPLALDGVASEESMEMVRGHLEQCAPCADYFDGMKSDLNSSAPRDEAERSAFDRTARHLRRKRRLRILRNVLIGMIIGLTLTVSGTLVWQKLTLDYNTPQYYGEYGVFLSRLASGDVALSMDYRGSHIASGVDISETKYIESGEAYMYVCNKRSVIKQYMDTPNRNYCFMTLTAEDLNHFTEIRQGTPEEFAVVWQRGDDIPAASEQMEAYFATEREIAAIPLYESKDGKVYAPNHEDVKRLAELHEKQSELRNEVPEWQ